MYSSIYRVQSSTRRLPIRALFGFMLKLVESYLSLSPQSLCVVVCPWCLPWVASEVSGTDSVRHLRHLRFHRPMSEFRHVPFWVRHYCLASVWSQSIQPPIRHQSDTHYRLCPAYSVGSDHNRHCNFECIIGTVDHTR